MDENLKEEFSTFNELHEIGTKILTQLQDNFDELERNCDQANEKLKIKDDTISNLTAELARCQKELQDVKNERDNLRVELNSANKKISDALCQSQNDVQEIKNNFNDLHKKLSKIGKVLAGEF